MFLVEILGGGRGASVESRSGCYVLREVGPHVL